LSDRASPHPQRRPQPAEQAGEQHRREGEEQHSTVDRDFVEARQVGRQQRQEGGQTDGGERHAERAAEHRDQQALGDQLSGDPSRGGAQSAPHGELGSSCPAAHELQAGDIEDGDQQDQGDAGEEDAEGAARRLDDILVHRQHPD
jgi:hypothetical protein